LEIYIVIRKFAFKMQTKETTIVPCFHVIIKLYIFSILLVFTVAYANACLSKWYYNNMGTLKVNIAFAFNHLFF
jgi:hypothetical protein